MTAVDRVLVAGGSGYLGRRLVPRLVATRRPVRVLLRGGSERAAVLPHLAGTEIAAGDLLDPDAVARGARGCRTVIHLVGIIRERGRATFQAIHALGTTVLVQAARLEACRRFLYVSALGARPDAPSEYHRTKSEAETLVRDSGLEWLVLRPSFVLARDGDFYRILARLVRVPLVPVLGPGTSRFQPIHADDLADLEVAALDRPAAWNQRYDVGGPRDYTFDELVRLTARGLRRRVVLLHVPRVLAEPAVALMARLLPNPPITPDELTMLLEGGTCDPMPAARAFGLALRPVEGVLGAGTPA